MMLPIRNTFVDFSATQVMRRTKSCVAVPVTSIANRDAPQQSSRKSISRGSSLASTAASDALCVDETRTTVIVRHVPQDMSQSDLLAVFAPMCDAIDFFYLPNDFGTGCNLGYAFVNLVDPEQAAAFMKRFQRLPLGPRKLRKTLAIEYASRQGYQRNVKHFRNSLVMREQAKFQPMIFAHGVQVPFPKPTKSIGSVKARIPRNANRK